MIATPFSTCTRCWRATCSPTPEAAGRLRQLGVDIPNSVFRPAGTLQMIEDCFTQILTTAAAIIDPFEQAFFVMAQLPYLQPFDDANERVSRLAANIPLIKANLSPLSFEGLPRNVYTEAVLGVYELNRVELLRDVFLWAYQQSATRYAPSRQSPAEADPFRPRHWAALRELAGAGRARAYGQEADGCLCRRVDAGAYRGTGARAVSSACRARAAESARGQFRALSDHARRVRGLARCLEPVICYSPDMAPTFCCGR